VRTILFDTGQVALVDDEDYDALSRYRWTLKRCRGNVYAQAVFVMHRFILGTPDGQIDHVDGDGLNNQRSNLRLATAAQNAQNRRTRSDNGSGYKGVTQSRSHGRPIDRWIARIGTGKRSYLGSFSTPEDAAIAYDEAARSAYGDFARTNFEEIP
jgi:HNH endonuclease/AP2 domain